MASSVREARAAEEDSDWRAEMEVTTILLGNRRVEQATILSRKSLGAPIWPELAREGRELQPKKQTPNLTRVTGDGPQGSPGAKNRVSRSVPPVIFVGWPLPPSGNDRQRRMTLGSAMNWGNRYPA